MVNQIEIILCKNNGYVYWSIKDEHSDNFTGLKNYSKAKRFILTELRQKIKNRILSMSDLKFWIYNQ